MGKEDTMLSLDLLDRLLEHDAWTTRRALQLAETLGDAQLDEEFDIGHRTIRATLEHVIGNIEVWTDLMMGRAARDREDARHSIAESRRRFDAAYSDFARVARDVRDRQQFNELYIDVLDKPPRLKSFGGTILHVITHDHMHRAEILHILQHLGVQNVIEGDVLGWEQSLL